MYKKQQKLQKKLIKKQWKNQNQLRKKEETEKTDLFIFV